MPMKNTTLHSLLLLACTFVLTGFSQAQSKPAADLVITNAKVWTVDKSRPIVQAVAVIGDRIVAVGSNADADVWRGPTQR
jgi:adenine deaminase